MTAVLPGTAVITRPRHPLAGLELRVLGGMRRHGRLELLLVLPDGSKRLIPAEWTSQHADSTAADGGAGQDGGGSAGTLGSVVNSGWLIDVVRGTGGRLVEHQLPRPSARPAHRQRVDHLGPV